MNLQSKEWYQEEKEKTILYIAHLEKTTKRKLKESSRKRQLGWLEHNKEYLELLQERLDNYDNYSSN